jgi:hypothetical protein
MIVAISVRSQRCFNVNASFVVFADFRHTLDRANLWQRPRIEYIATGIRANTMGETTDYVRGEMNVEGQTATYKWFVTATAWSSVLLMAILGYAIFTITMGVHWMVALPLFVILSVIAGMVLNLGAGFMLAVAGMVFLALFVQFLIFLGGALI